MAGSGLRRSVALEGGHKTDKVWRHGAQDRIVARALPGSQGPYSKRPETGDGLTAEAPLVTRLAAALFGFALTGAAGALLLPVAASAHPHVLIDAIASIVFDADGSVVAIDHRWTFDEGFSAYATQGLDADGNGVLDSAELAELAQINVGSLVDYGYFTVVAATDNVLTDDALDSVAFGAPQDYHLESDGEKLTLFYRLPLAEPLAVPQGGAVIVDVFDFEYFIAFTLIGETPVTLAEAPAGCTVSVDRPEQLDDAFAAILAMIPADGELSQEQMNLAAGLSNRARVRCGG